MSAIEIHLDTRFDAGLSFLRVWQRWRDAHASTPAPQRPLLHYVALCKQAPSPERVLALGATHLEFASLTDALATSLWGLLPGLHRLPFEGGSVQLSLLVAADAPWQPQLRQLSLQATHLQLKHPDAGVEWSLDAINSVAKLCQPGALVWVEPGEDDTQLHALLAQAGFAAEGTERETEHHNEHARNFRYAPRWQVRRAASQATRDPSHAIVVGAGLSGAAVAHSLARRGWRVTVLDAAAQPAQGASSLPVGLLVPHVSPDDALISRATRAGVRATLHAAETLLVQGQDWELTGALFSQHNRSRRLPARWSAENPHAATWAQDRADGVWHERAAWIKPQALVRSWLAHERIRFIGNSAVATLEKRGADWAVLDAKGRALAQAPLVVLCTAFATRALLPGAALGAMDCVAGQVVTGHWQSDWPHAAPVSGEGHFISAVSGDSAADKAAPFWLSGSTYERAPLADLVAEHAIESTAERLKKLGSKLPAQAATAVQAQLDSSQVSTWRGERCTTSDRLPTVGPVVWQSTPDPASVQVCIGMGSRGLTFAALCAELLAAQLHGEPWPVERRMAQALSSARWHNRDRPV